MVEKKLLDFTHEAAIRSDLTQGRFDATIKPNIENLIQIECQKCAEVNEKEQKEEADFDGDENEIDVENVSDNEDCCEQSRTRSAACLNRSPSPVGSVKSESSSKSSENFKRYERSPKQEEDKASNCRSGVVPPLETSKAVHRQRFNVNLQKQNTQSVIINGKRYYRK